LEEWEEGDNEVRGKRRECDADREDAEEASQRVR
jgi:hypothetical protein